LRLAIHGSLPSGHRKRRQKFFQEIFCFMMTLAQYFAELRQRSIQQIYQKFSRVHHMPMLSEI